ncbi:hypothetical protein PR048_013940 [Dryococelus australis]|uniref:Reverse transcriptase domain-containing protein n=1 Tax=Dryococelus australis TaxID=614101 RepID=A0ABQ9HU34_9NEOP|nr:hypothetical protein PR048_013940 [Dryococelus australis]
MSQYPDLFKGIGFLSGKHHLEIDTSAKPVQQPPHRYPTLLWLKVKEKLTEMIKDKIILPELTHAKVFSILDVKRGFWQMQLDEATSRLTTFWGPDDERYKLLRYLFVLLTAPEDFQRALMKTLRGLKWVVVIADDILVYGRRHSEEKTRVEHGQNLECLLERAQASNLKFKSEKLRLHERQVTYMGHVLSPDSLKADPHSAGNSRHAATEHMELQVEPEWTRRRPLAQRTTRKLWIKMPHKDETQLGTYREGNTHNFLRLQLLPSLLMWSNKYSSTHRKSTARYHFQEASLVNPQTPTYNITVKYKKGKELYLADTVSSASVQEDLNQVHDSDQEHAPASHRTLDRIQQCTIADGGLQTLHTIIKEGWPERKSDVPEHVWEYWHCRD